LLFIIHSLKFTPFSNEKVPTGDILTIEDGTELNFRREGGRLLTNSQGNPLNLDHNFVVDPSRNARKVLMARTLLN
jgi:hypothetical protein